MSDNVDAAWLRAKGGWSFGSRSTFDEYHVPKIADMVDFWLDQPTVSKPGINADWAFKRTFIMTEAGRIGCMITCDAAPDWARIYWEQPR